MLIRVPSHSCNLIGWVKNSSIKVGSVHANFIREKKHKRMKCFIYSALKIRSTVQVSMMITVAGTTVQAELLELFLLITMCP